MPGLTTCDQLHVHTAIATADGQPLEFEIYGTINALGEEMRESSE